MKKFDLNAIYALRRASLATWMAQEGIGALMFQDTEGMRTPNVRYFTGHPMDAMFVLTVNGSSILCPWDINLANIKAHVDKIIPYTDFGRTPIQALKGLLKILKVPQNSKIEIPSNTPYPQFLHYVDELADMQIICREKGSMTVVDSMRTVKDDYEIYCIKKAAAIGDKIIDIIEKDIRNGSIKTETDVALLIEKELRKAGCERTGFDTLAAGPSRSWGIHCFPGYTDGPWGTQGLSILDFGVVWEGYTSDTTLTVAKGPLTQEQKEQLELVEKAYKESLKFYKPGCKVSEAAIKADEVFASKKRIMPHSLGHSYGLECHEFPVMRSIGDNTTILLPGVVETCEPGLYDPKIGGCRLENDVLITDDGHEILTHSRIIKID
ncbi:MAG: peptidase M24 [Treponema sp. CETP13]|nr:MAG: peptidase M24 [Treponema sp. CETP13]